MYWSSDENITHYMTECVTTSLRNI